MRFNSMVLLFLIVMSGCSSKNLRIGGMMCPAEYSQEQVNKDMHECRFYGPAEDAAAAEAAFPREVTPECIKCLEERGYQISE